METSTRSWNGVARAAAAAAIAAIPVASANAQTPIEADNLGTITADDIGFGSIQFDLDGDDLNDFELSSFYGSDLMITPLASADPPAAVLIADEFSVARFETAADVFAAATTSDSSEFTEFLSDPFSKPTSSFLDPGFFGLLFEIPGGSPYIAAVEIDIDVDEFGNFTQIAILGGSYQLVPTPGALALAGVMVGVGLRRRR